MAGHYYVKDHQGRIVGPYSGEALRRLAKEGKLLLTWQISKDQKRWVTAAKVQNLFADLEIALSENLPTGNRYRSLTRQEQVTLFLDRFVLNNQNFKDSFPWFQTVRKCWAKLTLPSNGFVITEVTGSGIRHIKYDLADGQPHEIETAKADKEISQAVKRFNWLIPLYFVLALVWVVWLIRDFSLTWGTAKTVAVTVPAVVAFVFKLKRTRVFIGYDLDPEAAKKLEEISEGFAVLKRCGRVWLFRVELGENRLHWKYNAGDTFTVSRLPVAIFNRPIPNVETNLRVNGLTFPRQAIYFLPEKLLVVDGRGVLNVDYRKLRIATDQLEYVETDGRLFKDSQVVGHRWKFINKDGTPDRRFKDNFQLPVVRCGILRIDVGGTQMEAMTTNPAAPGQFKQKLRR